MIVTKDSQGLFSFWKVLMKSHIHDYNFYGVIYWNIISNHYFWIHFFCWYYDLMISQLISEHIMKKHGASQFSFGYAVVRGDKNLTDQTLRVLSVHSCGLDVVSSYVKVFLCALSPRVLSTVITLRLMCLRAKLLACNNLEKCVILW